jgi:hypothetical protein
MNGLATQSQGEMEGDYVHLSLMNKKNFNLFKGLKCNDKTNFEENRLTLFSQIV